MKLTFSVTSEPYDFDVLQAITLADAIEDEAATIASDAGSELLDSPSEAARIELRNKVIADATRALQRAGDTYTDPTGVRWTLTD